MSKWYGHTGFEFMGIDRVRSKDREGFIRLWDENVNWLRDVADECASMIDSYKLETQGKD